MGYYLYNDELYHHGVKGMKWGVRKANKYQAKARDARASAKEWDEIRKYQVDRLRAKGKTKKASARDAKYRERINADLADAKRYDDKVKSLQKEDKFRGARADVGKSRSTGAKIATNILAGPFANRTYNSVIASGGTKNEARAMTAAASLVGGPLGHLVVSALYTRDAGKK